MCVKRMETMKQTRLWNSLGTHGSLVVIWWLCISSNDKTRKSDFLSQIWPWRLRSIAPQNNKDFNQGILHLWSKLGGPSLNGWWVIAPTNLVTDGRTDAANDNTRRPKWASGKNLYIDLFLPYLMTKRVRIFGPHGPFSVHTWKYSKYACKPSFMVPY